MCADFKPYTSEKREEILLLSKKPLTSINLNKIDMESLQHPRVKTGLQEFHQQQKCSEIEIGTSATGKAQNLDTDGVKLKKNRKRNTKILILEDFLIPALNDNRYGDILKWTDKTKGEFSIKWSHGNSQKWETADSIVFQDWDKLKNKFKPEQPGYYNDAKQRFRCALNSKNIIRVNFPKVIVSRVGKVEKVQSLDKKFKSHREDPLSVLLVCSWLCW
ncbi:IRF tryptophan pentad repeat domain-containing protein [Caerostris extrusa]|uniref:IRF tryptophan pentad repeat domain-containing protein n=1 Tax=Caerostris extrusa TaxID=172846 RepID=A0AAV4VNT1_CAEEX|nr:IRF tryptophan pentad repeat domain-containing protein [Caerostris extrusa]